VRPDIVGKRFFDVIAEIPHDSANSGEHTLRESLQRVFAALGERRRAPQAGAGAVSGT
jgi:hypothetical protein